VTEPNDEAVKKKKKQKDENPQNLYMRGDTWILNFCYRGERYTEVLGCVSRSRAKEIRDDRRGSVAAGELAVNSKKLWKSKKWVPEIEEQPSIIEDPLLEDAMEKYMPWYKANRKESSYKRHSFAKNPLIEFFKGKHLSEISTFDVEKYKLHRKAQKKNGATINRELALLSHLYTMSITWKLAEGNPVVGVALFKETARERYLTEEEGARVLANCKPNLRLLALAAASTGIRTGELRETTWTRINFFNHSITVSCGYSKNGETRTIPLHPKLEAELQIAFDKRKPAPDDFVFLNDRFGTPYKSWRTAFKTAMKKAGITDFVFHDLRHCFGSYLGMNNTNPKAMQELMGHKRIEMTMRYTHLSVDYKRSAVAKLPSFDKMETESQQISQQPQEAKVVSFGK
jgi:integrase